MISYSDWAEHYMDNLRPCDSLTSDFWGRIPIYDKDSIPRNPDVKHTLIWVPAKPAVLRADSLAISLKGGNLRYELGKINLLICHGWDNKGDWCPEYKKTSFVDILLGIPKDSRKTIEAIIACNPSRQVLPTQKGFHTLTYCLGNVSSSVKLEREQLKVSVSAEELIIKGEPA